MSGGTERNRDGTAPGTNSGTQRYTVPQVARLLGISERAVRKRIDTGTLAAERDGRRWLVCLVAEPEPEPRGTTPEPNPEPNGTDAEPIEADYRPVPGAARAQLEAIRDEWLLPLVDRMAALEREAGMLTAERDAARHRAETAEAERDALTARLVALEAAGRATAADATNEAAAPAETPQQGGKRRWWAFWRRE